MRDGKCFILLLYLKNTTESCSNRKELEGALVLGDCIALCTKYIVAGSVA